MRRRGRRNRWLAHARSLGAPLAILIEAAGCTHAARVAPKEPQAGVGLESRSAAAFAVDAHALMAQRPKRLKLRFYAESPDRLRVEGSFVIGGVALIATGRGDRVRIVVPSRRVYAECSMEEDLGSKLIGVPITGCEIAALIRQSTALPAFLPCGSSELMPGQPAPSVLSSPSSDLERDGPFGSYRFRSGLAEIKFEWGGEGLLPRRVDILGLSVPRWSVSFTAFHTVPFPQDRPEDFFWEPPPAGARRLDIGALGVEADP